MLRCVDERRKTREDKRGGCFGAPSKCTSASSSAAWRSRALSVAPAARKLSPWGKVSGPEVVGRLQGVHAPSVGLGQSLSRLRLHPPAFCACTRCARAMSRAPLLEGIVTRCHGSSALRVFPPQRLCRYERVGEHKCARRGASNKQPAAHEQQPWTQPHAEASRSCQRRRRAAYAIFCAE